MIPARADRACHAGAGGIYDSGSAVTARAMEDSAAALELLAQNHFDLVLLDPPFDAPGLLGDAIEASTHLLKEEGAIYVESDRALPKAPEGLVVWRRARAGAVWAQVLRRSS